METVAEKSSLFSKIETLGEDGFDPNTLSYVFIGICIVLVVFVYVYRDSVKSMLGSLLLRFHLGKSNEIQTTEISPSSRLASIIGELGLAEEITPI